MPGDFDLKSLFIAADPFWQQQAKTIHCKGTSAPFSFLGCVEIKASLKVIERASKSKKKRETFSLCMMDRVELNAEGGVIKEVYLQLVGLQSPSPTPACVADGVLR